MIFPLWNMVGRHAPNRYPNYKVWNLSQVVQDILSSNLMKIKMMVWKMFLFETWRVFLAVNFFWGGTWPSKIKEKNNKFESKRSPTYPTKGWLGVQGYVPGVYWKNLWLKSSFEPWFVLTAVKKANFGSALVEHGNMSPVGFRPSTILRYWKTTPFSSP